MNTVNVALTLEQIAAIIAAGQTFIALTAEIKAGSPNAWPDTVTDFEAAVTAWHAADVVTTLTAAQVSATTQAVTAAAPVAGSSADATSQAVASGVHDPDSLLSRDHPANKVASDSEVASKTDSQ